MTLLDNSPLPYIVFWDVDKTMIGHADAACDRYWLMRHLKDLEDSHVLPRGTCPTPLIDARREIEPLLRPGLRAGLDAIRAALPGAAAEFFVCSYGKECVLEDLKVKGIEEATGLSFCRPIFCVSSDQARNVQPASGKKKLVRKNFDEAARSLARKYPALEDPAVVDEVFRSRFFMVDDTRGIAFDAASNERVIVCPAFEHRPAPSSSADPLEGLGIPETALRHPMVQECVQEFVQGCVHHRGDRDDGHGDDFFARLAAAVKASAGSMPDLMKWAATL